ncbi:MAG: PAS domain S-box protein [Acidobacteria bacterium]|nr:PAS domain S-box protein [Acidobacteriota bacterium]
MLAVAPEITSIRSRLPLRLLIVEDSLADAELAVAILKRAGYLFTHDIVDSQGRFQECLRETEYDVILSDHNLLNWTGLDALNILRQSRKDIPFIVVTAILGDEAAVDYIKRGANDYVLKHRLERLPVAVGRALREKQRAEETARLQEAILCAKKEWELTFDAVPEIVLLLDEQSRILRANRAAAEMVGLDFSQLIGQHCQEVLQGLSEQVLATGQEAWGEVSDARSGKVYEAVVSPLREHAGKVKGCVCAMRDITQRRRAEEALRDSEERHRNLFENANDIVYTTDLAGNFTSWNKVGEQITGYTREEALQTNLWQVVAPEYVAAVRQGIERALAGETIGPSEIEVLAKDGSRVVLEVGSQIAWKERNPVGIQGIARDITDRKKLESQFLQAQKMEAIGRLAGGVAHDFNNLLNVVIGYATLLLDKPDAEDRRRRHAEQIKRAGERAVVLTRQLLAFSRKQVLQLRVLDLNRLITDMEQLLKRLIGEDIETVTILEPDLGRVKADAGQIEQVIMNLVVNSKDAMPQGGKLTLQTANIELDEDYARRHAGVEPGPYVMLAVSDTGVGMDPEVQARIFEPFFTTKPPGKGTGLGLSTVYGIIKQSRGDIWVYSEPGRGTTFKIYMPRVQEVPEPLGLPSRPPEPLVGSETILLVEDEASLRELAREFLETNGYRLLEAKDGLEAVEIAEHYEGCIHLLLTDVVMPGLSGRQLVERLEPLHPHMKVIYMSGYTDDAVVNHGGLTPGTIFIEKPFMRDTLLRKVREALEQRGRSSSSGGLNN